MNCVFCGEGISIKGKVGRSDVCFHCGMDLRCCKQCKFFDSHVYNECREVSAERVLDKEKANFCEYFLPVGARQASLNKSADARKALEALFKK